MYSSYIQDAAAAMADRMNQSPVPLYGSKLRLPNRQAVILLIKEIRKLMFPAYFGDPELMSLAPADYAALILERVEAQLRAQIALALPESEADRAAEVAREIIERMPYIQEMLLKDLDATFDGDPAACDSSVSMCMVVMPPWFTRTTTSSKIRRRSGPPRATLTI